jgi:osmotically-inducible protein OsmY
MAVLLTLITVSVTERARSQENAQHKGAGFNDAVISEQVKKALNKDAGLRAMDISVDVQDRVVHLRGFVNALSDVAKAESLARAVQGVSAVKNEIRVANRPSRA